MPVDTHGHWPFAAAALVAPSRGAAPARRGALGRDDAWVAMLGLPILVAHQTEEWVRPPQSCETIVASTAGIAASAGLPPAMKLRIRARAAEPAGVRT
jgi:hypothetical protein